MHFQMHATEFILHERRTRTFTSSLSIECTDSHLNNTDAACKRTAVVVKRTENSWIRKAVHLVSELNIVRTFAGG